MKESKFRSISWCLLIAASLCSYTYLNCFKKPEFKGIVVSSASQNQIEAETEEETKVFLPDIALVKKLLNITKIVMPKD